MVRIFDETHACMSRCIAHRKRECFRYFSVVIVQGEHFCLEFVIRFGKTKLKHCLQLNLGAVYTFAAKFFNLSSFNEETCNVNLMYECVATKKSFCKISIAKWEREITVGTGPSMRMRDTAFDNAFQISSLIFFLSSYSTF